MQTKTVVGVAATGAVVVGGGVLLWTQGLLSGIGLPGPGGSRGGSTVSHGIAVTIGPNVTSPKDAQVGGVTPGPSGQYTYPTLWAIAPQTLPLHGYQGGPAINRPSGNVWLTIATNLTVSGTYKGGSPSAAGSWNGIAEYADGQLVRVYPQPADAFGGSLATLGAWSGGGAG